MNDTLRIALAQISVGGDKAANLATIAASAERAARQGVRLAVFPEASMFHFGKPAEPLGPPSETLEGPFVSTLAHLARRHRMWILAGMFERIDDDPRVFNTLVLLDDGGLLHSTYRKIHLYDAFGYRESSRIAPGDGSTLVFALDGMRLAAMTCYDLRFPELARHLTLLGAQAILLPSAWLSGVLKEMQFETLLRARAIENAVYLGTADQCTPGYCGNSVLFDPMGVAVAGAGEAPTVVVADLSAQRVEEARAINPSLGNLRPEVYENWTSALRA